MPDLDQTTYGAIAALALITLALACIVIFWARFCSPFVVLLVLVISLLNFGLLLSGLQRLAQHASLTIGLVPIVLAQLIGIAVLGWISIDVHRSRR